MLRSPGAWQAALGDVGRAALLGLLAGAGQPGLDFPLAFFVSYVAFCWLALRAPSWSRAIVISATWGTTFLALMFIGTASWGAHVPAAMVAAGVMIYALPIGLWSRWAPRIFDRNWQLFLATAGFWGAWQALLDRLGLPLRGAALALTEVPELLAGVSLVGTAVIEGLLLATCLCVALALADVQARARSRIALASVALAVALASLSALGLAAHRLAPSPIARLSIGIPQINVGRDYYEGRLVNQAAARLFAERFDGLVAALGDVDLLVTSETYDGRFPLLFAPTRERWSAWARARGGSALITSFLVDETGRRINAAAGLAAGRWVGVHEKIDLAPFGETPLAAGEQRRPLRLSPTANVGVLICNEAMLQHPSRELVDAGANFLIATVNDVSFGSSLAVFEHLASARLRAIEVGRDIVWASNAGPSGVIDRWGRFVPPTPFRQPVAVRAEAALYADATPLQRAGWLPAIVCGFVLLVLIGHNLRRGGAIRVAALSSSGGWGSVALGATGIVLSIVVVATSSGLVEARRGDPRRAGLAIQEALRGPTMVVDQDPYARFREAPTADLGAIGYFLEYFGSEVSAHTLVADLEPGASLERVAAALAKRAGLRTQLLPVTAESMLPRVAALARLADGRLVVANQPRAVAEVSVFDAAAGQTTLLAARDFVALGAATLLVPAPSERPDSPSAGR